MDTINSDLIRGHIDTIILRALSEGDRYGYQIIKEIEQKSNGQYTLKQPTLYSCLKRLEKQELITSFWGQITHGGRRRYYKLTDKGRKVYEQNQNEWEYSRTIIDTLLSNKPFNFVSQALSDNSTNDAQSNSNTDFIKNASNEQSPINAIKTAQINIAESTHNPEAINKKETIILPNPENKKDTDESQFDNSFFIKTKKPEFVRVHENEISKQNSQTINFNQQEHISENFALSDNSLNAIDNNSQKDDFDNELAMQEYRHIIGKLFPKDNSPKPAAMKRFSEPKAENMIVESIKQQAESYEPDEIIVRNFDNENDNYTGKYHVYYNKLALARGAILCILMLLQCACLYAVFNLYLKLNILSGYFISAAAIALAVFFISLMLYLNKPNYRKRNFYSLRKQFISKLFLSLEIIAIIILAFYLYDKNLFLNIYHLAKAIIFATLALNIVISPFITAILYSSKKFTVSL